MPTKRKTLETINEEYEDISNEIGNVHIVDLNGVGDRDQASKPQRSSNPGGSDTNSLPMSASVFRFEANDCELEQEVNETEHLEITEDSPTGRVLPQYAGKPYLGTLKPKILKKILGYVLPMADTITPFFKAGTNIIGPRGWSKNDEGVTFIPNIDAAILQVNKACHEAGTDILYGTNHFRFTNRADCCHWWVRHIGDHNLKKITMMTFVLSTGWLDDHRDPDLVPTPFESSFEEDWFKALSYVEKKKIQLNYLGVKTHFWNDLRTEVDYTYEDRQELNMFRCLIVDKLHEFKNVEKAQIDHVGYPWIGMREEKRLEMMMQQKCLTREETPMPKVSWVVVMEDIRARRQIEEQRAEQERLAREERIAAARGSIHGQQLTWGFDAL